MSDGQVAPAVAAVRAPMRPVALVMLLLAGCASSGKAARIPVIAHTPEANHAPSTDCRASRQLRGRAHVELFARGDIVVLPAGIGVRGGRRQGAYVRGGRCRAKLWTREPTGLVELGAERLTLGDLFANWGHPLTRAGVAGFRGPVRAWLAGAEWRGSLRALPLADHAQVVVQVGAPLASVHGEYTFP